MKSPIMAILTGLASVLGWASLAHAQAVVNVAGASAAKPFVEEVPVTLCDNPTGPAPTFRSGAPIPEVFMDGPAGPPQNRLANSKFITWRCQAINVVGRPNIVIRYQSTGSGDGIKKVNEKPTLPDGRPNPAARQVYVLENPSACGAPIDEVDALGRTRRFYPRCTQFSPNPNTDPANAFVVNMGVSDVAPSSYGQRSQQTPTQFVEFPAQPDENITLLNPVVTPYSIVLGSAVKLVNPDGTVKTSPTNPRGRVRNLTQMQVEAIFSRQVTRWDQLSGIGADTNGDGRVDANDNQTIIICSRRATSGTKAAFQATLMKDAKEHTGASPANSLSFNLTLGTPSSPSAGPTNLAGISNNDVRDCIQGNPNPTIPSNDAFPFPGPRPAHPTAAAYMEAEQAATVNPEAGYVVSVDGGKARRYDNFNGQELIPEEAIYIGNEKENVRCGKLQYWAYQNITRRNDPPPTLDEAAVIDAFFASASSPNIINNLPNVGRYWVSPVDMHVTKQSDKGPVQWKPLVQTRNIQPCLPAVNEMP
ncbi:MAG: substrate-binding domain-containing protein [Nitrospira sp.]|nr:substrate-binding domain-containing protein [Nitrospira sp.]MCP9443013.1 substrate-binding domain-containing protein [Nitrospira sp.]